MVRGIIKTLARKVSIEAISSYFMLSLETIDGEGHVHFICQLISLVNDEEVLTEKKYSLYAYPV